MHRLIEHYFRNLEELKKESGAELPFYSNNIEEDNEIKTKSKDDHKLMQYQLSPTELKVLQKCIPGRRNEKLDKSSFA